MERRAKERLIGASILVVLLVLVVPELLSGPKPPAPIAAVLPAPSASPPEPTRTITLDLATSKPTAAETDGGANDSAAPAPAPAPQVAASEVAASAPAAASVADQKPATHIPPAAPRRSSESSTPLSAPARDWTVQLGSFANRGNADNLVRKLRSQGFKVYASASGTGRAQRFRVRVGPLADRAAADRAVAKLKALGHTASVVPPAH